MGQARKDPRPTQAYQFGAAISTGGIACGTGATAGMNTRYGLHVQI
jgi:hypothetical protein